MLALNHGVICPGGVIDSDYRGQIGVTLINQSDQDYTVKKYETIGKMVLDKYHFSHTVLQVKSGKGSVQGVLMRTVTKSHRGAKGYGSTGVSTEGHK